MDTDPAVLTPLWANLAIAAILVVERIIKYFFKLLMVKGDTKFVINSCCGLCGGKVVAEESRREITISNQVPMDNKSEDEGEASSN